MRYIDRTTGEEIEGIPGCDMTNPASLEAWYGNFSFFEPFRKVVLAQCKEIERAKATGEKKVTEARLEDLARVSDVYVQFLVDHLRGRELREKNVLDSNRR